MNASHASRPRLNSRKGQASENLDSLHNVLLLCALLIIMRDGRGWGKYKSPAFELGGVGGVGGWGWVGSFAWELSPETFAW